MTGRQGQLERDALEFIRAGDLEGAHAVLAHLAASRPGDAGLERRLAQVSELIRQRQEAKGRLLADPIRYAEVYIEVGRPASGLQLLRNALSEDPDNARLRTMALQIARQLRDDPGRAGAGIPPAGARTADLLGGDDGPSAAPEDDARRAASVSSDLSPVGAPSGGGRSADLAPPVVARVPPAPPGAPLLSPESEDVELELDDAMETRPPAPSLEAPDTADVGASDAFSSASEADRAPPAGESAPSTTSIDLSLDDAVSGGDATGPVAEVPARPSMDLPLDDAAPAPGAQDAFAASSRPSMDLSLDDAMPASGTPDVFAASSRPSMDLPLDDAAPAPGAQDAFAASSRPSMDLSLDDAMPASGTPDAFDASAGPSIDLSFEDEVTGGTVSGPEDAAFGAAPGMDAPSADASPVVDDDVAALDSNQVEAESPAPSGGPISGTADVPPAGGPVAALRGAPEPVDFPVPQTREERIQLLERLLAGIESRRRPLPPRENRA